MIAAITVILFVLVYLSVATYFAFKVAKATIFSPKQKKINIFLLYLVPIIWWVLIYYMTKPEPEYDPELKRKPTDSFYETNKTIGGGFTGTGGQFGGGQ
jgi:hypothetical protein